MGKMRTVLIIVGIGIFLAVQVAAQQPTASPSSSPVPEKKAPAAESPTAKLTSARTVLITRARGNNIPYETIQSTVAGWMRFSLVDTVEKADIVISVESYGDSDVRVSSTAGPNATTGQMEQSSKTSKDLSATEIRLTVLDAKNKHVLWTSSEKVKFAMKKNAKESNMVEAAERLASRLHDRVEAPLPARSR